MQDQTPNNQPLFQNMDEQERVFAPEQVPGAVPTADEIDANSATTGVGAQDGSVAGADGDPRTTPVVAVRPDVSAATPVALPATTGDLNLDNDTTGRSES